MLKASKEKKVKVLVFDNYCLIYKASFTNVACGRYTLYFIYSCQLHCWYNVLFGIYNLLTALCLHILFGARGLYLPFATFLHKTFRWCHLMQEGCIWQIQPYCTSTLANTTFFHKIIFTFVDKTICFYLITQNILHIGLQICYMC